MLLIFCFRLATMALSGGNGLIILILGLTGALAAVGALGGRGAFGAEGFSANSYAAGKGFALGSISIRRMNLFMTIRS